MMHDTWTDRLSEYLDGDMDRAQREALEAHLTQCPECAALLEDLNRVRARARELTEAPVPKELWSRIERAIAPTPVLGPRRAIRLVPRGRFSFSLPELAAACLAVAVVSGGAVFALLQHRTPPSPAPVTVAHAPQSAPSNETVAPSVEERSPERGSSSLPADAAPPTVDAVPASRAGAAPLGTGNAFTAHGESVHEEAISELRKALASKRDKLDPATIRTLETNLAIIDLAIDQAKRALVADSANTYVKEHLAETMRRKVELLQRATMLASASGSEGSR